MKFKGVAPAFACACKGNGGKCSKDRARWASNGHWSDVCAAHMEAWLGKTLAATREKWTGRLKAQGRR